MPELPEDMYCSQQICIPPAFPYLLRQYAKAAIRTQPNDLLKWSTAYFRCLALNLPPPVKPRLEYPIPLDYNGLTPGWLKALVNQLPNAQTVSFKLLWDRWIGACLKHNTLIEILLLGKFTDNQAIPWLKFIALCAGHLTENLTHTMIMVCEILTEEPEGGSAMISAQIFMDLYRFLAEIDASKPQHLPNIYFTDSVLGLYVEEEEEKSTPSVISSEHEIIVAEVELEKEASVFIMEELDTSAVVSCPDIAAEERPEEPLEKTDFPSKGTEALPDNIDKTFDLDKVGDEVEERVEELPAGVGEDDKKVEEGEVKVEEDVKLPGSAEAIKLEEGEMKEGQEEEKKQREEGGEIDETTKDNIIKQPTRAESAQFPDTIIPLGDKIVGDEKRFGSPDETPAGGSPTDIDDEQGRSYTTSPPISPGEATKEGTDEETEVVVSPEDEEPLESPPVSPSEISGDQRGDVDTEVSVDETAAVKPTGEYQSVDTVQEDVGDRFGPRERLPLPDAGMDGQAIAEETEGDMLQLEVNEATADGAGFTSGEGLGLSKSYTISFSEDGEEEYFEDGRRKIEEEPPDLPRYEWFDVPVVPGIGPTVPIELVEIVNEYMTKMAKIQHGVVMPRNIRHFSCPPLEVFTFPDE